jgi:copper chaperone
MGLRTGANPAREEKESAMSSTMTEVTLTAPDISCAHCVATIEREVGVLPGVAHVEANVDTKKVDISYDPSRVSLTQIEAALDEAGYPVQK